jgi:hypothetical protein
MANRLNLKMIIKNITGFHFKFIEEGEEKLWFFRIFKGE